jgi:O-acetyl-ADP-ribose deacetylase (regulator of RNase III)
MIRYLKADVTQPTNDGGIRVIVHACNDQGGWGPANHSAAASISKRWKDAEDEYRQQFVEGPGLKIGEVQLVNVEDKLWVANCIVQKGYRRPGNLVPFKYEAFEACCNFLIQTFANQNASFHMPKVGCGHGGADWHTVEHIIQRTLIEAELSVTVYIP